MATAKRKPRTASRSTKRAPARKSGSSPVTSVLTLGAIVAVGAVSLWAASQHKSPQAAISSLFNSSSTPSRTSAPTTKSASLPDKKTSPSQPAHTINPNKEPATRATATAPVPRPEIGLSPTKPAAVAQAPKPPARPQNTANAVPVAKPNQMVAVVTPPSAATKNLPPRGVNKPDSTPTMVYARQKLTVHKTAWDKSPSMGEVEKGRELRSYGQTGKWHRVVVPATDMIGWVHQDMLVIVKKSGHQSAQASAPITTGSIKAEASAKPLPFADKTTNAHPVPQRSVGSR